MKASPSHEKRRGLGSVMHVQKKKKKGLHEAMNIIIIIIILLWVLSLEGVNHLITWSPIQIWCAYSRWYPYLRWEMINDRWWMIRSMFHADVRHRRMSLCTLDVGVFHRLFLLEREGRNEKVGTRWGSCMILVFSVLQSQLKWWLINWDLLEFSLEFIKD